MPLRLLLVTFVLMIGGVIAEPMSKPEPEQRLLKIESRVYGWYGIAEPSFDRTIGRRELFRISGGDQFLKGLAGRLLVLEGHFHKGQLVLPALAPPPVSMPEQSFRQRFVWSQASGSSTQIRTEDGYLLNFSDPSKWGLQPGRWAADLVVEPVSQNPEQTRNLNVLHVLALAPFESRDAAPPSAVGPEARPLPVATPQPLSQPSSAQADAKTDNSIPGSANHIEVTFTQELLDRMVDLAFARQDFSARWQAFSISLSSLRLLLSHSSAVTPDEWSLEGTLEVGMDGTGTLAETSFVGPAKPVVEGDRLLLEPAWDQIRLEGQLPMAFRVGGGNLGPLASRLPKRVPIWNLQHVTRALVTRGFLSSSEGVHWFLTPTSPGTVKLGLSDRDTLPPSRSATLEPGSFQVLMSASVADRLIRHQISSMLSPEQPFEPNPPIQVGRALFVPIRVEKVFVRSLTPGYSRGAFRFDDLLIDVGWKAGPLQGVEPVLKASGWVRPKIQQGNPNLWSWDVVFERLEVISSRIPGNPEKVAQEMKAELERELGEKLAQKQRFPTTIPLSKLLGENGRDIGSLEFTRLEPLDDTLLMEGRLVR